MAVLVLGSCGGGDDAGDNGRLADAEKFRVTLVNVTGQHHLSISDYVAIRDEVCGGSFEPIGLMAVGDQYGLTRTALDESVANALWTSGKDACPDAFADGDDFLPFPSTGGSPKPLDAPAIDVATLDTSILEEPTWQVNNGQLQLIAESTLTTANTVEHFRTGLGDEWQVLEVVGPFGGSMDMWSLDISDGSASGVINIYDRMGPSTLTDAPSAVIVQIVLVDVDYPLE